MSEIVCGNKIYEKSSKLVEEIVELRQLKLDQSILLKTNTHLSEQISNLELQISDLKAQITAKDHEILSLTSNLSKTHSKHPKSVYFLEKINNISRSPKTSENSFDLLDFNNQLKSECKILQSKLEQEKHLNEAFEKQLKELTSNINASQFLNSNKTIEDLKRKIEEITEENLLLKWRLAKHENFNLSEIEKNSENIAKNSTLDIETLTISEEYSTPRYEDPVPSTNCIMPPNWFPAEKNFDSPKKFNPLPPKTRCNLDYPKKALNSTRTKYVKFNLTEVINSPKKQAQIVDYCPSHLRKFRNVSS